MLRFAKNKSSVAAAWILAFLILYAIIVPFVSPYDITKDQDPFFKDYPAFIPGAYEKGFEFWSGSHTVPNQNETAMNYWKGIELETGKKLILSTVQTDAYTVKDRGKEVTKYFYDMEIVRYYEVGCIYMVMSYKDFAALQQWQNETGIQAIMPWVDYKDINNIKDNANLWYKLDKNGAAKLDKDGNFVPVYSKNVDEAGAPYDSLRIEGDDGSYAYSFGVSGAVRVRLNYYNYYQFLNGTEPMYILGTTALGQDLFCAIGAGARFSLIFAILVSAVNMSIGAVYGAIQGYYGGTIDMILDRISDILSGVPMMVVITLFQLHLGKEFGALGAFVLAFVVTGWIGMAALTRKQFYRFKSQEFVMAARTLGASDRRLMFKHIFPNAIGTIITSCALIIPGVIRSETTFTYLGIVNLQDTYGTTIGTLLSQGNATFITAPHTMLWPSIFMGLLMISFNLFGNGLRDAFNPTTRGAGD
jgi:oligopeptide transport system permease protein